MTKKYMINNDNQPELEHKLDAENTKPDEHSGVAIQGFLKIFDPESGEIIAQGRA